MKKYSVMSVLLIVFIMLFSGCSDVNMNAELDKVTITEKHSEKKVETTIVSKEYQSETTSEKKTETIIQTEQMQITEQQSNVYETEQLIPETEYTSELQNISEQHDEFENVAEITDIEQTAQELFEMACKTTWNYIIDCPYELDYQDTFENAVRVIGVNSLDDILIDYNKVFIGECPEINEKYRSTQYALYCYDGGRGANIYYQNTELELVSIENDMVVFNAVSHYADTETYEPMEDKENIFTIVRVDGEWRVSEFTLPY